MKKSTAKCQICGKCETTAYNKPNSLHRTKKRVGANLQKHNNKLICTRCLRTQAKSL